MWSLELGASPEGAQSDARRRAHDLRAATVAEAIAAIVRPLAAIFRRRRDRSLVRKVPPVPFDGIFDAKAHSIAAIGSAADAERELPQQVNTASVRLVLPADAEPPVLIEHAGTVATLAGMPELRNGFATRRDQPGGRS